MNNFQRFIFFEQKSEFCHSVPLCNSTQSSDDKIRGQLIKYQIRRPRNRLLRRRPNAYIRINEVELTKTINCSQKCTFNNCLFQFQQSRTKGMSDQNLASNPLWIFTCKTTFQLPANQGDLIFWQIVVDLVDCKKKIQFSFCSNLCIKNERKVAQK